MSVSGARIDGLYRYRLWREWCDGARALFIMLNPSTADAEENDPTIRRCIGYAKAIGAGRLEVVNLFALRATNPAELLMAQDPIGPDNDDHIIEAAREVARERGTIVCAWGCNTAAAGPTGSPRDGRGDRVCRMLAPLPLHCLQTTAAGFPSHPLYLPAALRPVPYSAASKASARQRPQTQPSDSKG